MLRFMVAFHSEEGQTEKVAHHVARQIENHGQVARLISTDDIEDISEVGGFDAAIVAGALHMGAYGFALKEFVFKHADDLNKVPSAFLTVSLSAASDDPLDLVGTERHALEFQQETNWTPEHREYVAGAVRDRQTGPLKRLMIHTIMWMKGVKLDPSGTTEFTDWPALDRFVKGFVAEVVASRSDARL